MTREGTTGPDQDVSQIKSSDEDSRFHTPSMKDEPTSHDAVTDAPSPSTRAPAVPPVEPPPNGEYGWVCTACCAFINAHTWGINSSYGVFLAHYLSSNTFPGASYLEYAFVGSLSIACALLVSPVATITTRKYSTRVTLLIGTLLETASLIGASFAWRIWHLFLSQGVCFGFGMGFLFVGSVGIPPQWFTTRRSLANGIATAGSGIGGLTYSLATGVMIQSIGLPWAFRVLGILAFSVNGICALLMRDRNKQIGASQLAFDVSLFRRPEYLLLLAWGWFSMLAYVTLLFSIANFAESAGFSASQASTVSALLNLGQGLGRPPIGYFSDAVGRINMAGAATFIAGFLVLVVWTNVQHNYGALIFFSIAVGLFSGTFWTTIAPVSAEIVGLKHVPSALSICWIVLVLPCTFSEPIGLEIVAADGGTYTGAQLFVGFMYIAGSTCILVLRGWKIGELETVAAEKQLDVKSINAVKMESDDIGGHVKELAQRKGRRGMLVNMFKMKKV